MASFYGWVSTDSRLEPLLGDSLLFITKSHSLLFITKSPGAPSTYLIDLKKIKD